MTNHPFVFYEPTFNVLWIHYPQIRYIAQKQPHFTHDLNSLKLETLDKNEEDAENT